MNRASQYGASIHVHTHAPGTRCACSATRELGLWMLTAGFMVGIVTDLVVLYGGG